MSKEKLFTPEDFDKPKDISFWQKYKRFIIVIAALLIIVAIVLWCIFCGKTEQKADTVVEQEQKEQISNNPEPNIHTSETEAVENETTIDTQDNVNVEVGTAIASDAETPKSDVIQEVTSQNASVQPVKVSDNVEQEAMNVIRGEYGNIPERREKLGSKYQEIQNRVNQLKKEGVF